MSSIWGEKLKISIFGESHGPAVGVVIDGLPSGIPLDFDKIGKEMGRRRPSTGAYSTKRKEADEVEVLSGLYQGRTTGTPLCGLITNTDTRSGDYEEISRKLRPGHADYTASLRYGGFHDIRGGGHFSARLTAPLVFAGALARQYLETLGITLGSHIYKIHDVMDLAFDLSDITKEQLLRLHDMEIPVNDQSCVQEYLGIMDAVRKDCDSVGGIIEVAAVGLPGGMGSPIFSNVEARLSSILFSVPAVKGVEFGAGFSITEMFGSEANDSFYKDGDRIRTRTNHNGGINGGITNGMPLVFRVAMKPTPSIAREQDTVDIKDGLDTKLSIKGRHDACIVPRAVPVIEAACAIALMDLYLMHYPKHEAQHQEMEG